MGPDERGDRLLDLWHITASGVATEEGLGSAKGTARFREYHLRIDWVTGTYKGYYEWALDQNCAGKGKVVFTAGERAGQSYPSTVRGPARTATTTSATTPGGWTATVGTIAGEATVFRRNGVSEPITAATVLGWGDRVVTAMESNLVLRLPGGSVANVGELTDFKIETGDEAVKTRLWLKAGVVDVDHQGQPGSSDFACKLGTAVCGVRGTTFTLFSVPGGDLDVVSVRKGVVELDPNKPSLPTTSVTAGRGETADESALCPWPGHKSPQTDT